VGPGGMTGRGNGEVKRLGLQPRHVRRNPSAPHGPAPIAHPAEIAIHMVRMPLGRLQTKNPHFLKMGKIARICRRSRLFVTDTRSKESRTRSCALLRFRRWCEATLPFGRLGIPHHDYIVFAGGEEFGGVGDGDDLPDGLAVAGPRARGLSGSRVPRAQLSVVGAGEDRLAVGAVRHAGQAAPGASNSLTIGFGSRNTRCCRDARGDRIAPHFETLVRFPPPLGQPQRQPCSGGSPDRKNCVFCGACW